MSKREKVLLNKSIKRKRREAKLKRKAKQLRREYGKRGVIIRSAVKAMRKAESVYLDSDFSIEGSPENVIKKVRELERFLYYRRAVYIDMKSVLNIDYAALSCLLAVMYRYEQSRVYFNGNFPQDDNARKTVLESGFLSALGYLKSERAVYTIDADNQFINLPKINGFDDLIDERIVPDVSRGVWGVEKRLPGLRATLQELSLNTYMHAGKTNDQERWWVSINYDREGKKVRFVFLDYGLGIITSLKGKNDWAGRALRKIIEKIGIDSNDLIMEEIVDKGGLTATREDRHGTGIHGIKRSIERNQISSLVIMSNNVLADVDNGIYKKMRSDFPGTLFSWELGYGNENFD